MATIADLLIKVKADTDKATKDLDNVGKKGSSSLQRVGKVAKFAAAGLGTAAGIGLAWAAKTGFQEFQDGQKVAAQTNAVLKSTGGAAGVTADHISDLAGALLKKSGMDDEAIQSGENLLLTFTNIRNEAGKGNDIFDQTTKTMVDMSVALGQDTKSSAIQLGKALNDPIKGVTALQRVGVSFTQAQKDQIKALVESGNTLGAQKLILRELNKEFGGSAEAAGKTLPGAISIARESLNNWLGEMVGKAIPIISNMVSWLRDHWPEIQAAFKRFWGDVKPILDNLAELAAAVVGVIRDHWGTIKPLLMGVLKVFEDVAKNIATALKLVTALLRGDWSQAWQQAKNLVLGIFKQIKDEITVEVKIMATLLRGVGNAMKNALLGALAGIGGKAWDVINNIGSVIASVPGTIKNWGAGVGSKIVGGILGALDGIGGKAWNLITQIGERERRGLSTIAGWGADIGGALVGGIVNGLKSLGSKIVSLIKAAVNSVIDRINSALVVSAHIKVFGKKVGFTLDPPDIPHLAKGVRNFGGGLALVGEHGPELTNLPGGSTVHTAAETKRMLGGNDGPDGDIVLVLDGEVLGRVARKELTRTGRRNVGLSFT